MNDVIRKLADAYLSIAESNSDGELNEMAPKLARVDDLKEVADRLRIEFPNRAPAAQEIFSDPEFWDNLGGKD